MTKKRQHRWIRDGVLDVRLLFVAGEAEGEPGLAYRLWDVAEVAAAPGPAGPILFGRVVRGNDGSVVTVTVVAGAGRRQLPGVDAGALVDGVLPGDEAPDQTGAVAPADLSALEESIRRVIEALPEDVGRV